MVSKYPISQSQVRVAYIVFNDYDRYTQPLTAFNTLQDLINSLKSVKFTTGMTNTGLLVKNRFIIVLIICVTCCFATFSV